MRTADTHPVKHKTLISASAIVDVLVMSFTPHGDRREGAAVMR
jgi:hypothetical protein